MPRNEGDPRLRTRTERRAQQRADEKAKKERQRNRAPYIVGATVGAAAILGVGGIIWSRSHTEQRPEISPSPIAHATQQEYSPFSSEGIIQAEIKRRNIQPSVKEKFLWEKGFRANNPPLPVNEETKKEAERRVQQTLDFMKQSENPHLKSAAEYYENLKKNEEVNIAVSIDPKIQKTEAALTKTVFRKNKAVADITFTADPILNGANSIQLAFLLAHEIEHAKNMKDFDSSMPSTVTLPERITYHSFRDNNPQEVIQEEARGNGKEAEAFIVAQGLLQYPMNRRSYFLIDRAAMFIQSGSNVQSPEWQKFIQKEYNITD